jgi:uncharacterized protein YndB with AHSA1/START domain
MDEDVLRLQVKLAAPAETVFRALTRPDALEAWFAEHADISLPERRYDFWGRFTPEAPGREFGRHALEEAQPARSLAYAWRLSGQQGRVAYKLLDRGSDQAPETILTVRHEAPGQSPHGSGSFALEDFWFISLENLRRHLDGKPADARVDFSSSLNGDIRQSLEIDAPAERVFEVLIRPEMLERWIASHATVEPWVGGAYGYGWEGVPAFKILALQPNQVLAYSWPEDDRESTVTWTLEPSGGKTRLTIVHSGFAPDQPTGGYQAGWLNFLNWIRSLAEYEPGWTPPVLALAEGYKSFYAAAIGAAQGDLVAEI